MRSPLTPKFKARSGLKYFDNIELYLDKSYTIDSPISNISAPLVSERYTNFLCSKYQPGFEILPAGVDGVGNLGLPRLNNFELMFNVTENSFKLQSIGFKRLLQGRFLLKLSATKSQPKKEK